MPALQSKIWGADFTLVIKKGSQNAGITIVVSKKVAKLAVDRNRIKRLFKEALRSLGLGSAGLVIIVKKNIAEYKTSQIKDELKTRLPVILGTSEARTPESKRKQILGKPFDYTQDS
ncbi:ribonuclease P protein component [Candidatus Curtissbacteria bacterium]|nr:ribonuclease P protein component [Candidatus Curtissbacteria bacterium]